MNKIFTDNGWKDYVYWQAEDRKMLRKINQLIEDIDRNGNEGIGNAEKVSENTEETSQNTEEVSEEAKPACKQAEEASQNTEEVSEMKV